MRTGTPIVIATLFLVVACTPEPTQVFVPGPGFQQSIQLTTALGDKATVGVGEPLILHAQRRTGPWMAASRSTLTAGACWLGAAPPELESEVADNLRWFVEPEGSSRLNVAYRDDHTREVRFSAPGVYRLTAQSANWCAPPYGGNALTVQVVLRQ